MCGLVGLVSRKELLPKRRVLVKGIESLISGAERRGKDASGYIFVTTNKILFDKFPSRISHQKKLLLDKRGLIGRFLEIPENFALFLHSRMETHGSGDLPENNHPISRGKFLLLHNGIILNHKELGVWTKRDKVSDTDSETLLMALEKLEEEYPDKTFKELFNMATFLAEGANTFILLNSQTNEFFLSSSNRSLYFFQSRDFLVFASEKAVVLQCLRAIFPLQDSLEIKQVTPESRLRIDLREWSLEEYPSGLRSDFPDIRITGLPENRLSNNFKKDRAEIWRQLQEMVDSKIQRGRQCKLCLLPDMYPGIELDESNFCNVCTSLQVTKSHDVANAQSQLEENLELFKKLCGSRVLVPFSGGRDSSFLLHKLKVDLDLDVTAFTYDWGFVTETARENISRICGSLEVEHLLISADLKKKRRNVALNVEGWNSRPHPGIIPLFMAGDKQFFRIASSLRKEYGLDSIIYGMNRFEAAPFKTSTMGITETPGNKKSTYAISFASTTKMALFFAREFLLNPKLINISIFDTLLGFQSYYWKNVDYHNFFDYYPWRIDEVENILGKVYGWKDLEHPMRGWRNGDATAPFYNLLYNLFLGYNENNVFIANLLRGGQITLDSAATLLRGQQEIDQEGVEKYFNCLELNAEIFFRRLISNLYFQKNFN